MGSDVQITSTQTFPFCLQVVTNHPRLQTCSQKLIVPREKFPPNVRPGSTCLCTVNGRRYVCFVYPDVNKFDRNFCAIDKCVSLPSSDWWHHKQDDVLTKVEIIESRPSVLRKLSVKIHLNGSVFGCFQGLSVARLKRSVQSLLELYHVVPNSVVDLHDTAKSVGIDRIEIISADGESPVGTVSSETQLEVDDVQFVGVSSMQHQQIAGMEHIIEQLDKIRDDGAMPERFSNWAARPSFNTLIVGSTGSGKTSVCHNFIRKNRCNVFELQSGDVIQSAPGGTEYELRKVFANVKEFVRTCRPKDSCPKNEKYLECGPSCQTECATLNEPCLIRHIRCPDGCYCIDNYARITPGGKCVPKSKCH